VDCCASLPRGIGARSLGAIRAQEARGGVLGHKKKKKKKKNIFILKKLFTN
jgi:hypothetical protein